MVESKNWTNYETQSVYEHLVNDDPEVANYWKHRTKVVLQENNDDYYQTVRALGIEIQSRVEVGNPLADDGSLYDELLTWALGDVEWSDVAEQFINEFR